MRLFQVNRGLEYPTGLTRVKGHYTPAGADLIRETPKFLTQSLGPDGAVNGYVARLVYNLDKIKRNYNHKNPIQLFWI